MCQQAGLAEVEMKTSRWRRDRLSEILKSKIFKYFVFGSIAALFQLFLLFIMVEYFSIDKIIASQASLIAAIMINYFMQRSFTFQSNVKHAVALPGFLMISLAGNVINFIVFSWLSRYSNYVLAQAVALLAVFVVNFTLSNLFVFRRFS